MRALELVARRLGATHRDRLALEAVIAAGSVLFWVCAQAAGSVPTLFTALYVLALALVLVNPHLSTGTALLLLGLWLWFVAVDDATTWWQVPAALALLVTHGAQSLLVSGPDPAPVPREILRRWAGRVGIVAAATLVVGCLAITLDGRSSAGVVATVVGLGLLAVALVALPALVRGGDERSD